MKIKQLLTILSVILLVLTIAFPSTAQLTTKKALTLEAAKKIAAVAESEAMKNMWTMVIVIVDDGGNVMYLERMDNTQIGSIEVAIKKSKSAISFKRPTKAFEDAVAGGRTVILKLPGALPVEGGIPIMADGKLIGAIGVSGVQSNQDAQIAQAAIDALAKILGR